MKPVLINFLTDTFLEFYKLYDLSVTKDQIQLNPQTDTVSHPVLVTI